MESTEKQKQINFFVPESISITINHFYIVQIQDLVKCEQKSITQAYQNKDVS